MSPLSLIFPIPPAPAAQHEERFQAEFCCLRCKAYFWADYGLRRMEKPQPGAPPKAAAARCPKRDCPAGSDYAVWTGHIRPKPGMWKDEG